MTLTQVIILAVVQGLTEFLPVSSSGHLLLARALLGVPDIDGTAFDAFLHLGTLGAVIVYYWRVWWSMDRNLLQALVVATIPGAAAGYLWQDVINTALRGPRVLALSFLFTAAVLWWFDRRSESAVPAPDTEVARVSWWDAFIIGLAQVLALIPAVSRSAVTIAAGRGRGLSRPQATTFSFIMSAPIIAGASISSLITLVDHGSFAGSLLITGTLISFVSGLLAIYLLMRFIERMSFTPFVVYLVGLAVVIWIVA